MSKSWYVEKVERHSKLRACVHDAVMQFVKENGKLDTGDINELIDSFATMLSTGEMLETFERMKLRRLTR